MSLSPEERKALDSVAELIRPPDPVPSFWRYLWEKNQWAYFDVLMTFFGWIVSIVVLNYWWMALIFGILLGASAVNALGSWSLWRKRKQFAEEDAAWVAKMSTGERAFPREIAQAMHNLINQDKSHVAAALAIEYLKAHDPEARRWFDEFDALPEDEKKRRSAEALEQAEKDIR